MKRIWIHAALMFAALCIGGAATIAPRPQTTQPSTQPAAVPACEQRYSSGAPYGPAPIIIDGVTDRISWPRPATCRRLLGYVAGGNQVADRDGENPALIGTPWRDIDARRFALARDAGLLVAQGVQSGGAYNRWRFIADIRRPLGLVLPRHDAERLGKGGWDGAFLDNVNGSPLTTQGGSFAVLPGEYVDSQAVRDAQATYALEFRLWYRVTTGRDCYMLANVSRPHVWYEPGAASALPLADAWPRTLGWLRACGFDGVMLEWKPQYAMTSAEAAAWSAFARAWRDTGRDLILKRLASKFYSGAQLSQFEAFAAELAGPNVYVSRDP